MAFLPAVTVFTLLLTLPINQCNKQRSLKDSDTEPKNCPDGQVLVKSYLPSDSSMSSICCKPWHYNCPLNYEYTSCTVSGGWDECRPCFHGYIQPFISNSTNQKHCYKAEMPKICAEDKVRVGGICVCDLANNLFPFGDLCDYGKECHIGSELQKDGTCQACLLGTYKKRTGYKRCQPWTNCERNGMVTVKLGTNKWDSTCSHSPTVSPTYNGTSNTTQINNATDNNRESKQETGGSDIIVAVIGCVVGALVIIAVIMFVIKYRPCRSKAGGVMLSYVELQARQYRDDEHLYEQVQSSDDDLENLSGSPVSDRGPPSQRGLPNGGQSISTYRSSDSPRKQTSPGKHGSDLEAYGLTVNLPDEYDKDNQNKPIGFVYPQPRNEEDQDVLRLNIIRGEHTPFDNYLRITGSDWGGGEQTVPDNIHDLPSMDIDTSPPVSPLNSPDNQTDSDGDITDVKHV